jgi:hypothetical protein
VETGWRRAKRSATHVQVSRVRRDGLLGSSLQSWKLARDNARRVDLEVSRAERLRINLAAHQVLRAWSALVQVCHTVMNTVCKCREFFTPMWHLVKLRVLYLDRR